MTKTIDDKVLIEIYEKYQHNILRCMHEAVRHGDLKNFIKYENYYDIMQKRINYLYDKEK